MEDQNLTTPEPNAKPEPTSTATATTGGKVFTEEELETIVKERLSREQAKREKAAKDAADKARAEEAAKQGEYQKLAEAREKELADLKAQFKARELDDLKRAVAEKAGLPAALASRLIGETEADLEKDAKALLDTLPKTPKPQPGPVTTNPGNPTQGETDAQKLARIYGGQSNPWDISTAKQKGGGVYWPEPKE